MENITLPSPHRILKLKQETVAEQTFRVEWHGTPVQHGQFFMLSIPKVGEAPISVSARGDGYVEFTIRKVGRLTGGLFGLGEGDMIFMRGPYGNSFPVEDFKGKHLAVIAGGTGLAPVRSTLQYFYDYPEEIASVYAIAGFKDPSAVLFREDLEKFSAAEKFHTYWCLDNTEAPGFHKGFVTQYISEIPFASFEDDYNVIIVGPPAMFKFAAKGCMDCGAAEDHIWVSFERKMACAVGKCGHCKVNETYVCLNGPVFNYTKAKELLD
ncbi:MAG: anaerobic sulfite reductase subunit AsrB [Clostridiales bacterium]|nr:anaerobic sulfite reductase subunit AsrB [Clostridiales bacterium]